MVLLLAVCGGAPATAQGVDHWWGGFGLQGVEPAVPGMPAGVTAMAVYRGRLVVAGQFGQAGRTPCSNIAAWDGRQWHPLLGTAGDGVTDPTGSAVVEALAVYQGELVVAGRFASAGGVAVQNIARWNGFRWAPLGSGITGSHLPATPVVKALAVYGGQLYAGGHFLQAGGVAVGCIARWDGATGQWSTAGPGFLWPRRPDLTVVNALAVHGGRLVAAGVFQMQSPTGAPANHIAAWDGSTWRNLGSGLADAVEAVADDGHGGLLAGGLFTWPARYLARWDGTSWGPATAGDAPQGEVSTLV
ncbi:MAG: hypothetical protein D6739_08825, partial [Nitrospirae bacterium]